MSGHMTDNRYNELQQAVIGILILYARIRPQLMPRLGAGDFTDEPAAELFRYIQKYPDAEYTVITGGIRKNLREYAVQSVEKAPFEEAAAATVEHFIRITTEKWLSEEIQSLAFSGDISVEKLREITEKAESRSHTEISSFADYISRYSEKTPQIKTGFPKIDRLLNGGIRYGTVTAIGARPSTGKTTFALNLLKSCVDTGIKIMFFSLEMSACMLWDRIAADVLNISYSHAQEHNLSKSEYEQLMTMGEIYKNLKISDSVSEIEKIISLVYAEKPVLAVIDYMQIITSRKEFRDNRQRIDYISQMIKKCAKSTQTSFIVLSQVTRAGKDAPTMSDLKESGALEQDSDYVFLLHRPYVQDKSDDVSPREAVIKLDKNKFGNTGIIELDFDGKYQRFTQKEDGKAIARPIVSREIGSDDDLPF